MPVQQSLSTTADFDPDSVGLLTPGKRTSVDVLFDDPASHGLASGQLSSTKLAKQMKTEWKSTMQLFN